jgi:hypothetical protein
VAGDGERRERDALDGSGRTFSVVVRGKQHPCPTHWFRQPERVFAQAGGHCDADADAHADADANADANPDANADAHADAHAHANTGADSGTYSRPVSGSVT